MALFGKKEDKKKAEDTKAVEIPKADKKSEKKSVKKTTQPDVNLAKATDRDLSRVLVRPHITEKTVGQSQQNVYTFEVRQDATKIDVRDAVTMAFGVTPVKVNIVKKSPRQVRSRMRGTTVKQKGMKKAYVYLKDGDSITLV